VLRALVVSLLVILVQSCQSPEVFPKRTGHEFVPISVGAYWEYAITETTISAVNGQTNELSELRVEVIDSVNFSGQVTYILQRSTRPQGAASWSAAETWSARLETFQYVQQEGNVPFIKLQFPLSEGKSWDGNALNTLGGTDACPNGTFLCDNYTVSNLNQSFELPGVFLYDNTVTIVENDDDDPIVMKDLRQTVYAKDVGLVYREELHLEYCTVGSCIGQQVVENGFISRQTLTSYGLE
jgi:hypothetical protein